MFRLLVALASVLLIAGAGTTDLYNWQVKCGLGDNKPPYYNDASARFGVSEDATWGYDGRDAVHPPLGDPNHDLGFFFIGDYWRVYEGEFGGEDYGWPPPWKPWIPQGEYAQYPSPGLIRDIREPDTLLYTTFPEYWLVSVQAPNEGATMSFVWFMNMEPGLEVPLDVYAIEILGNRDLESVGIEGNLVLTDYGPGEHHIEGIPQFGIDPMGNPIRRYWVIQAEYVPEPAFAWLAGLAVSLAELARRRRR